MHRILILIALLIPVSALAWNATITANGNHPDDAGLRCYSGEGRVEVFDGDGGYDSGTVTFQFKNATGDWETVCPTAADCQWATGDSGAIRFDIGADGFVRLNLASVASAADLDVAILCDD